MKALVLFACSIILLFACSNANKNKDLPEESPMEFAEDSLSTEDFDNDYDDPDDEDLVLDTMALVSSLKRDVSRLLAKKDPNLINDTIFGDCIYLYLHPEYADSLNFSADNRANPILKQDILSNFRQVLNASEIKKGLKEYEQREIGFIIKEWGVNSYPFIYKYRGQKVIFTVIVFCEEKEEGEEFDRGSRMYWFGYMDGVWKFCGLNCGG